MSYLYNFRSTHVLTRISKSALPFMVLCISMFEVQAQQLPSSNTEQNVVNPIDLIDVIHNIFNKKSTRESEPQIGKKNRTFLPIVGYGPANGFVVGMAVGATKLLGNPKTTQMSSAITSVSFTSEKQTIVALRTLFYLPDDKWIMAGDDRILLFSQPTYGLGIYDLNANYTFNIGGTNLSGSPNEQPMKFDYIRIYHSFAKQIKSKFYIGLGFNFDIHRNIQDQSLKLDTPNQLITSNYYYSTKYGFSPTHYSTNGLVLQFIEDSRDYSLNAYKGIYANLAFRVNQQFLGSSQNSTMLIYEWRNYIGVNKNRPADVLAFWSWGEFVTSGAVPYLALPAIGWDTYGRSGRGYIQGRLRGKNMIYGEAEYRLRISRNGLFGMVAFLNATTASNPNTNQPLFYSIAPGYGIGFRIKMNKKDRSNICIDYGRGLGSSGIYFNLFETF